VTRLKARGFIVLATIQAQAVLAPAAVW